MAILPTFDLGWHLGSCMGVWGSCAMFARTVIQLKIFKFAQSISEFEIRMIILETHRSVILANEQ